MVHDPEMKQRAGVIRRIAAAAAQGFGVASAEATEPRGARGWVEHCRAAADAARAAILATPPTVKERLGTLESILTDMQRHPELLGRNEPMGFRPELPEPDGPDLLVERNRPQVEYQLEGEELLEAAHQAAARAFRACMPLMTSRSHTAAFIACLAVAGTEGYVTPQEGRSLAYNAQLALAAFPRRK